jgi:hypothetical protein
MHRQYKFPPSASNISLKQVFVFFGKILRTRITITISVQKTDAARLARPKNQNMKEAVHLERADAFLTDFFRGPHKGPLVCSRRAFLVQFSKWVFWR